MSISLLKHSSPKSIEQQKKIIAQWQESPITRHYSFSDKRLWQKQEEVLWSVRNNKKTVVKSGNTVGKTWIAADVIFDFLSIYYPAKVITTAPGWTQVEGILWKEIALYYHQSKIPIGGDLLNTELKFNDEWFAMGISTNEVHRLQGFHSPYLLVVIDEASGVSPEIWEAVESLHSYRVLAIGNPLDNVGNFFNCFSSPQWNKITISCEEAVQWQDKFGKVPGLVTREWIDERAQEWGRKSALYDIHVRGEFPQEAKNALVSRALVEQCRKTKLDESEEDNTRVLVSDIATKHGSNETVIGYRYGHTVKDMKGWLRIPTTESADKLSYVQQKKKVMTTVIDSDGVGEGVSDTLISRKIPVTEFHGGSAQKAIDQNRFKNLRTQFYWTMAKKFEKGLYDLSMLPDKEYEILKNQLCSIRVKNPDPMGRIQIETKEDMQARGVTSPDFADTFMMMEYGWYMAKFADLRPRRYM